ncbi:MAG TPA: ethanolamine ammonia-lyase reactivating factor EutA [Stellaceae bacterium]|nr:ethanolamine ammonia-lyase reactivating factor EutA [Stellaceae bacterium]
MPHDLSFDHEHALDLDSPEQRWLTQAIWEQEVVELLTVGIDIGSSTSHLLFARVVLKRESEDLSARFVVVDRQIVWRSPILLTPFVADGTIDAHQLRHFFQDCYRDAGFTRADVDSGAVILTGEAIKKTNARAIDEIFAAESGKFVCATAGHKLECILAAHGSGATALSRTRNGCGLHVDIGGGTTKLALVDKGEILSVAAFAVGGRLIAQDSLDAWTRIDDSAHLAAKDLGLALTSHKLEDEGLRRTIARRLAEQVVDQIAGVELDTLGHALELTEPLDRRVAPEFITFSGGVSEYIFGYESKDHGDIARMLAEEVVALLPSRVSIPVVDAGQRIRATVIGASQFTVQVSGKTIYMTDAEALPIHNLPVAHLDMPLPEVIDPRQVASSFRRSADRQDLSCAAPIALAFTWEGLPEYSRLRAMAEAIVEVAVSDGKRDSLLALVSDGDIGKTLGRLLDKEFGLALKLISIDGIQLKELDFVDLGAFLDPPGVVPVVIKSLLFS